MRKGAVHISLIYALIVIAITLLIYLLLTGKMNLFGIVDKLTGLMKRPIG